MSSGGATGGAGSAGGAAMEKLVRTTYRKLYRLARGVDGDITARAAIACSPQSVYSFHSGLWTPFSLAKEAGWPEPRIFVDNFIRRLNNGRQYYLPQDPEVPERDIRSFLLPEDAAARKQQEEQQQQQEKGAGGEGTKTSSSTSGTAAGDGSSGNSNSSNSSSSSGGGASGSTSAAKPKSGGGAPRTNERQRQQQQIPTSPVPLEIAPFTPIAAAVRTVYETTPFSMHQLNHAFAAVKELDFITKSLPSAGASSSSSSPAFIVDAGATTATSSSGSSSDPASSPGDGGAAAVTAALAAAEATTPDSADDKGSSSSTHPQAASGGRQQRQQQQQRQRALSPAALRVRQLLQQVAAAGVSVPRLRRRPEVRQVHEVTLIKGLAGNFDAAATAAAIRRRRRAAWSAAMRVPPGHTAEEERAARDSSATKGGNSFDDPAEPAAAAAAEGSSMSAGAGREEAEAEAPHQVQLLLSHPQLTSFFKHTVMLVVRHAPNESAALVINRPLTNSDRVCMTVESTLRLSGVHSIFSRHLRHHTVMVGGPVIGSSFDSCVFLLHTVPGVPEALPLAQGLWLNGDMDELQARLDAGAARPTDVVVICGFAGWRGEQLAGEVYYGTWVVAESAPNDAATAPFLHYLSRRAGAHTCVRPSDTTTSNGSSSSDSSGDAGGDGAEKQAEETKTEAGAREKKSEDSAAGASGTTESEVPQPSSSSSSSSSTSAQVDTGAFPFSAYATTDTWSLAYSALAGPTGRLAECRRPLATLFEQH